jgi:hypothetical protein
MLKLQLAHWARGEARRRKKNPGSIYATLFLTLLAHNTPILGCCDKDM